MKALEQKEEDTPKWSRGQKIIKLRAEIDQIETKRTIQRIIKIKCWFFDKINKKEPRCPSVDEWIQKLWYI